MDPKSASEFIKILKDIAKDKLVIMVTHNIEQVEKYATKIIKMKDGKIIENKEVKNIVKVIENNDKREEIRDKYILYNTYKLGIRNTFNIVPKFIILFLVFLFIIISIFAEYTIFKISENKILPYYSKFADTSGNRILIKKQNKTAFTEEDYKKIEENNNIDYLIKDDTLLDERIVLFQGKPQGYMLMYDNHITYDYDIWIPAYAHSIDKFDGILDEGRMPKNENEIILKINPEYSHMEVKNDITDVLNNPLSIDRNDILGRTVEYKDSLRVIIVGIQYIKKYEENEKQISAHIYAYNSLLENLIAPVNNKHSKISYLFNKKYYTIENYNLVPSEKVERGYIIVSDDLKYQLQKGDIKNKNITIYVDNIYYDDELKLKISDIYTKKNFTKVTGYEIFNKNLMFVNEEDYNQLFKRPFYQSSVYVKNIDKIDNTIQELRNIGINAKKVTDYNVVSDSIKMEIQNVKFAQLIVSIVLVLSLYFISYFIIKIVLKSKNIYYTILRMFGANYKDLKRIIYTELFINFNIAYTIVLLLIQLVKVKILYFSYLEKLITHLNITEYLTIYILIFLMTKYITRRFARNILKDTLINSYYEEV